MVGVEAAALCMNFIVKSLDDMALGAVPGVVEGLDIWGRDERCVGELR